MDNICDMGLKLLYIVNYCCKLWYFGLRYRQLGGVSLFLLVLVFRRYSWDEYWLQWSSHSGSGVETGLDMSEMII